MLTKSAMLASIHVKHCYKLALALSLVLSTASAFPLQPAGAAKPLKLSDPEVLDMRDIKAAKKAEKAEERAEKKAAKELAKNNAKQNAGKHEKAEKPVKMDKATKDLGGANASDTNKHAIPVKAVSASQAKQNADTADAINKVPGMNIQAKDLQPPAEDPEIKGFHPIKKLLAPVIRLGKSAVQMQQQMMKIEGPVGALQPAMVSLQGKLQQVDNRVQSLDTNLVSMDCKVIKVSQEMTGIKQELGEMRSDVGGLRKPLQSVLEPLTDVRGPLEEVHSALTDMHTMMAAALAGIIVLSLGIIFGTPVVALYVYVNRHKFFHDQDSKLPVANSNKEAVGSSR